MDRRTHVVPPRCPHALWALGDGPCWGIFRSVHTVILYDSGVGGGAELLLQRGRVRPQAAHKGVGELKELASGVHERAI